MDKRSVDTVDYRSIRLESRRRARRKARKRVRRRRAAKQLCQFFLTAAMGALIAMAVMGVMRPEAQTVGVAQAADAGQTAGRAQAAGEVTEDMSVPGAALGGAGPSGEVQRSESPRIMTILTQAVSESRVLAAAAAGQEDILMPGIPRVHPGPPIIAVDAGHGGEDEGSSRDGVMEKDVNLAIARLLRDKLEESGYQVMMVREDDAFMTKEQRADKANKSPADIYVSIHQNTWEDGGVGGIETWYSEEEGAPGSKRLAQLLHQETVAVSGASARELHSDSEFTVTARTCIPSCLIETGFLSNPAEREKLAGTEYQEKLAQGIARGIDLYFNPKTMYLTFDDGPSEENTNAVLDILRDRNIKATFFVVGENVRKHPETARRIAAEGHTIGIHCNRHDYEEIYQSADSYVEDFEAAYRTVLEVTGVKARLYRFPGGSINKYNQKVYKEIIAEMDAGGFIYFDWNASLDDALKKSAPGELIVNARESTLGRKRIVLLAHDMVYSTAQCLDGLIDGFPEYRMEPLTPEVEPVRF